jgi:hypothetical protein
MGESDSWPLKVLALVFGDQSKLLAALCVAKDLVRGHAYDFIQSQASTFSGR